MNAKEIVWERRQFILAMALIFLLMLYACPIIRVHGSSAFVQSYEESVYTYTEFELLRCKIHISIETEHDGTWRNDTEYKGYVGIVLDWYNKTLCPNGVSLLINSPWMAYPWTWGGFGYVNQTPAFPPSINRTLYPWYHRDTNFEFRFKTFSSTWYLSPCRQRISTRMDYRIYNGSEPFPLVFLDSGSWELPVFWITIMTDPQQQLQRDFSNLQTQIDSLGTELGNIRNLMYVLILTTIILTATTIYLAIRKPKVKPELKTT